MQLLRTPSISGPARPSIPRPNAPVRMARLAPVRVADDTISVDVSGLIMPTVVPCLASFFLTSLVALQPSTSAAVMAVLPTHVEHTHTVRIEDMKNPLLKEGVKAATQRNFVKAEAIFSAMLQQHMGDADVKLQASLWSNLGNVHLSLGQPEIAVQDYHQAIQLAPKEAVPYLNRAIAREELGYKMKQTTREKEARTMWQAAIDDCDAAIARDAGEFAAYFNKGNVLMRLQQYDEASGCFDTAAELAPDIAGYRLRAAQLRYQQGDVAGAVKAVQELQQKHTDFSEAHVTLAAIWWNQGHISDAEGEYTAALELDPHWRDFKFVQRNPWPPALMTAMEKLLTLDMPDRSSSAGGPGATA